MTKKIMSIILIGVLCISLLAGCRLEHYNYKEAKEYIESSIKYDVIIEEEYIEKEDEGGYVDRIWTAYLKENPTITFEVISDRDWGMETVDHTLRHTYNSVYLQTYFDGFANEYAEDVMLKISDNEIIGYIESVDDIKILSKQMKELEKYIKQQKYSINTIYKFEYKIDNILHVFESDSKGLVNELESAAKSTYCSLAVQYQIGIENYTQEEIKNAVAGVAERDKFILITPNGEQVQYNDLMMKEYSYNALTFGTVYEVLKRNGYETLEGSPEKFSFVGIDGSKYEFSYYYNYATYEEADTFGYFYLKDGKQQLMNFNWYCFLSSTDLKEKTGYSFRSLVEF